MPLIRSEVPHALAQEALSVEPVTDEALLSPNAPARLEAIRRAARAGQSDLLVETLKSDSDPFVRELILTNLARFGGVQAIEKLARLIDDEDPQLRNSVIETLSCMGEEVIDRLASMLDDEDHNVRIYVLTTLGMVKNPRAAAVALQAALTDANINVCAAALDVVASSGSPEMIPQISAVADRFPKQPFLAFAARAAINRIG